MNFSLVFDNSNDSIEFDVVNNDDILGYFVEKCNQTNQNSFTDDKKVASPVDGLLNQLHTALTLSNSVTGPLCNLRFPECNNLLDYFDQAFLNKQHEQWVFSQQKEIDIDQLRFSENTETSRLGWQLHEVYPDDERKIKLAPAMIKLGYIFPYEEVNMTVHRLENFFARPIEYKADAKWEVFNNPFLDTMISNNDVVNFSLGYTYVGRQYYNKWQFFDTDLSCTDHYNYETFEYAFQVNLARPQTIPYSKEFLAWSDLNKVPAVSTQIPIANMVDIEKHLTYYRTVIYKNSKAGNRARISIH